MHHFPGRNSEIGYPRGCRPVLPVHRFPVSPRLRVGWSELGTGGLMTDSRQQGASEHVFATLPEVPTRQADASVAAGRLVVALVAVIVLCVTVFAVVIGQLFAGGGEYAEPQEASIGPYEFLVANVLPPGGLVAIALIALVAVAGAAIAFESIAALLSVNPKRDMLASLRSSQATNSDEDEADGSVRVTILVPAHNEEFSLPVTLAAL